MNRGPSAPPTSLLSPTVRRWVIAFAVLAGLAIAFAVLVIPAKPLVPAYFLRFGRQELVVNCSPDCSEVTMEAGHYRTVLGQGTRFYWVAPDVRHVTFRTDSETIVCPVSRRDDTYLSIGCGPLHAGGVVADKDAGGKR